MVSKEQGIAAANFINSIKYYTPDIEDLRIGYQCEVKSNHGYESFSNGEEHWHNITLDYKIDGGYKDDIGDIIAGMDDGYQPVRTPYLTKEQLRNEFKERITEVSEYRDGGTLVFTIVGDKYNYELTYKGANTLVWSKEIVITKLAYTQDVTHRHIVFKGDCPSINELRYINKLLKIK